MSHFLRVAVVSICAILSFSLSAATFVVTTTADSGPGSLRQAIIDSNADWAADKITFAIGSGPQSIVVLSQLPTITNAVTIDATTQPGYADTPLIEVNGNGTAGDGFVIAAGPVTLQGLIINRFGGSGVVTTAAATSLYRNWIGVDPDGVTDRGNGSHGVSCVGCTEFRVGSFLREHNVISGNKGAGISIVSGRAVLMRENRVGSGADSKVALPNREGVVIEGSDDVSMFTNFVYYNGRGVVLRNSTNSHVTMLNFIGSNTAEGVLVDGGTGNSIGYPECCYVDNVIENNSGAGIAVVNDATGILISNNWLAGNAGLGIDLANDGPTANDPLDADSGPNEAQNFPVITSAVLQGGRVTVSGHLYSTPLTEFIIDVYDGCHNEPSERTRQIGTLTATTDAAGVATFAAVMSREAYGRFVNATARSRATQSTSELSACRLIVKPIISIDRTTYAVGESDGTVTITVTRSGDLSSPSSVSYATEPVTATPADYRPTFGKLSWTAGESAPKTIVVPIHGDTAIEGTEAFRVTLSYPSGATIGTLSAEVAIIDDDFAAAGIPTASEWALIAMGALLAGIALRRL